MPDLKEVQEKLDACRKLEISKGRGIDDFLSCMEDNYRAKGRKFEEWYHSEGDILIWSYNQLLKIHNLPPITKKELETLYENVKESVVEEA